MKHIPATTFTIDQLWALEARYAARDGEEAHLIVLLARDLLAEKAKHVPMLVPCDPSSPDDLQG